MSQDLCVKEFISPPKKAGMKEEETYLLTLSPARTRKKNHLSLLSIKMTGICENSAATDD